MKKLFYIPILFFVLVSFCGCEKDESLDPLPLVVQGQFMRLDITRKVIDFDNQETSSFGGMLTNPSNDVVKYELLVRLFRASRAPNTNGPGDPGSPGFSSDYIALDELSGFPLDLAVKTQDVVNAYANLPNPVNVSIENGDELQFIAYSYDANGVRIAYRDLSLTVRGEASYKQAYKFNTIITNRASVAASYVNYAP